MQAFLIQSVEKYRLDSQEDVDTFLEELKESEYFNILKYSSERKEVKQKGEVVDSYYILTVTKSFNDLKDPQFIVNTSYSIGGEE